MPISRAGGGHAGLEGFTHDGYQDAADPGGGMSAR
jgi:hypothetical protein